MVAFARISFKFHSELSLKIIFSIGLLVFAFVSKKFWITILSSDILEVITKLVSSLFNSISSWLKSLNLIVSFPCQSTIVSTSSPLLNT